jgi:pyridoxamine 5'-phosphate oxidase family protein
MILTEIIRIHPRRVLVFNVDPERPGLQTREVGGDIAYSARWPE